MKIHGTQPSVPIVLGIDTSCDDTSAAVVRGTTILSNVIASQTQLHQPYGGVFPTVAKQAHATNITPTIKVALKRAHLELADVTAIAVTVGPGLAPALEVGLTVAKQLASTHHKPLIGINHMEAHALSALLTRNSKQSTQVHSFPPSISWPALAITISGGHTEFVLITAFGNYQVLGQTIDDAAGECLDKVGRMLNLGYPAGPIMEEFAVFGNSKRYHFPLPMTTTQNFDMSFSGLKTAARNTLAEQTEQAPLNKQDVYDFAASFQHAVFAHITYKLSRLLTHLQKTTPISSVFLGGGVAANQSLRTALRATLKPYGLKLRTPISQRLCSDNGAMIGLCGALAIYRGETTDGALLERQPRLKLNQIIHTQ